MTAVTFVVEMGDVRRFDDPLQLMAYLGLVPSESSTGDRVKRGRITKAGNRRLDISLSCTCKLGDPGAAGGITKNSSRDCVERSAEALRAVSQADGGRQAEGLTITAIAREMAAFLWAIGQEVAPEQKARSSA
ncbi:hypothetical protein FHT76_008380 [Rhizobium sp. BK176]|nr:hypothetical protein [Rhizobium sp. BK176]